MADAVFDAALRTRLQAFQKAHGLVADGMVSSKTWTELTTAPSTPEKTAPQGKSATEPTASPATAQAARTTTAPVYTEQNAPTIFKVARACRSEDGVQAFLRTELGVDLAEILHTIDTVLAD